MKVILVVWDWKDAPEADDLNNATHVVGGSPHFTYVRDTGGDDYAMIVSSSPVTEKEAQDMFEACPYFQEAYSGTVRQIIKAIKEEDQ